MQQDEVLKEVKQKTLENIKEVETMLLLSNNQLFAKPGPKSWSLVECIEHLNIIGGKYLPNFKKVLEKPIPKKSNNFSSGFMGKLAWKNMLPRGEEIPWKMKTLDFMDPKGNDKGRAELEKFIEDQKQLLEMLNQMKNVDLKKNRSKLSIPVMTFNLGDTLLFYVYHNCRHIYQANQAVLQTQ